MNDADYTESGDGRPEDTARDAPLSYEDVAKKFVVPESKLCPLNAVLGILSVTAIMASDISVLAKNETLHIKLNNSESLSRFLPLKL
ncbi:uncharacterized protein Bfra_010563 [Botrytis fragariae]|uniref:Uncharacterized protein n=1 Tax=Botrytis fragariae TaxID=1964551 RepID=A0A8H6ECW7_9HELO|nr:uncharacterized protein Bfra_010563 [Botrytis fragariae]KAF5867588.1 hypothetical protein Bfra_010563 [Botrytis fragariae]